MTTRTRTLILTALLTLAGHAAAADLRVEVAGLKSTEGRVLVAVYDKADTFLRKPVGYGMTEPANGKTVIANLQPGEYAVSLFHDLNGNMKLDRNLVGMPTEPWGVSNDVASQFGPPSFDQAKLTLPEDGKTITVTLH